MDADSFLYDCCSLSTAVWAGRMLVRLVAVVGRWVEATEITLATRHPTPMMCSTKVQEKEQGAWVALMRLLWTVFTAVWSDKVSVIYVLESDEKLLGTLNATAVVSTQHSVVRQHVL